MLQLIGLSYAYRHAHVFLAEGRATAPRAPQWIRPCYKSYNFKLRLWPHLCQLESSIYIATQFLFYVACCKSTVQSNIDIATLYVAYKCTVPRVITHTREILQKTVAPLSMERVVDGKLKSNLEWPNHLTHLEFPLV